ncbi:MAG: hypothetical protein Q4F00_10435 [bacterium]|nr:hypothetical protein [bacterium]
MKQFAGKARSLSTTVLLALVFALGLTLSGCSHDDDEAPVETSYATLVVKHTLAYERSLGNDVEHLIISGYDSAGALTFEPKEFSRTTSYSIQVPVSTASVRLIYKDNAENKVGLYAQAVTLQKGSEYVISDPAWQDMDAQNFLTELTISPEDAVVESGNYLHLEAMGTFASGGSTFVQTVTDDADWSAAEGDSLLSSKGKGSYLASSSSFGETEAQAAYAGVSASNAVTVLGEDIYTYKNILPEEYTEYTYIVPMCLDDAAHVQSQYASQYNFAPMAIRLPFYVDGENLQITFSDDSVAESEIVSEGESSSTQWLLFHPKSVGKTLVKIASVTGEGEEASEELLAYLSLETTDAKLNALLNEKISTEKYRLPLELEVPRNGIFRAEIYGVFQDASGRSIYADVTGACAHEFTFVSGKPVSFTFAGNSYNAGDKTVIIRTAFSNDASALEEGDMSVYTYTLTAPKGVDIYTDLDELPYGKSWNMQVSVVENVE